MSKLTNRIIKIPPEVEVNIEKGKIEIKGPLGKNELVLSSELEIIHEKNTISAKSNNLSLVGTFKSLVCNMIEGVSKYYKQTLEVRGVGYKVALKNNELEFFLGKSHYDRVAIPSDLKVDLEGNKIIITGI